MNNKEKSNQNNSALTSRNIFDTKVNISKGIDLKPHKTIRIAVSGDVPLNKLETKIIDTKDFQRLRDIKELGTTYLVYPTAIHTRFDHSLGTLFMAQKMIREIRENKHNDEDERKITDEQEQLIRVFALLHDIGHIPFGHTIEDEFCIFPRHDKDGDRIERFLGKGSQIEKILIKYLGDELYKRFITIYTTDRKNADALCDDLFIYDIVNNTVCADLLDYLRRDCYFCNIVLDMDYRFLNYLYLRREGKIRRLVIRLWKEGKPTPRRDVLSELIRLLDNRYLLGERVYFHHAKLITGTMVAGAVQRAKTEGKLRKIDMYDLGDEALLEKLQNSKVSCVTKLVNRLRERNLWKKIFDHPRQAVATEQESLRDMDLWGIIMDRWWTDPEYRTNDEEFIAEAAGIDSGDLLIHCPDYNMGMKLAEMKVFWNGSLRPLKDCKDDPVIGPKLKVILTSHENLWAIRAFLNPDWKTKEDSIINACNYLFTFEPNSKKRFGRLFYQDVVKRVVESENLAALMSHAEYEKRAERAIANLSAQTSSSRPRGTIIKIIKDAFKI